MERNSNQEFQLQRTNGEQSDGSSGNKSLFKTFKNRETIEVDRIGGVEVAIESNPDQTLILYQTENASATIAVDITGVSIAEALEAAPVIGDEIEDLARGPVFATDGGESGA